MDHLVVFSPAKLNLFLAVTGRRHDGFHDLVSVVAPVDFGDTLRFARRTDGRIEMTCDQAALATDETNLVMRAAQRFRARTGWSDGVTIELEKRIPLGAGLGGGSSNAVATLRALNTLAGEPLDPAALREIAAQLGSDCPLFLAGAPVVMRGRGERIEPLPAAAAARVAGQRVLIFKPAFGIDTVWAYRELAAQAPAAYLPAIEAEARLAAWMDDVDAPLSELFFNSLERAAFGKFLALPALLARLESEHGWVARMSGSGSACFGVLAESQPVEPLAATIRAAWGDTCFVATARIGAARV